MKSRMLALFLAVASFASANDLEEVTDLARTGSLVAIAQPKISEEKFQIPKGMIYIRTGVGGLNNVMPGIGLGYRRAAGNGAVDLSTSFLGSKRAEYYSWSFPKIAYLHYFTPEKERSFYAGGGMAWAGLYADRSHDRTYFLGLTASATLGLEFLRNSTCRAFSELTVSQPAVEAIRKGRFPGPNAEMSVGIGF